jgi:hypothetical protein
MIFGEWTATVDSDRQQPACDVVETRCKHEKVDDGRPYYNNMHIQVYKKLAYGFAMTNFERREVKELFSN